MIPTNADCLVYNDYGTGTGRRFIKHAIKDVYWDEIKGQNIISMGVVTADSLKMFSDLKDNYISPEKWQLLAPEDVPNYFTLQEGDILVFGTPDSPSEFTSAVKATQFFRDSAHIAHIISSIDIKFMPWSRDIHHFEIIGG